MVRGATASRGRRRQAVAVGAVFAKKRFVKAKGAAKKKESAPAWKNAAGSKKTVNKCDLCHKTEKDLQTYIALASVSASPAT